MSRAQALVGRLAAAAALAGGIGLLAIVLVTTTNAGAFALDRVARLFGATVTALPGYEDFVRLVVSSSALLLLPWTQHRRGHVAVDVFVERLPRAVGRVLDRLVAVAMAALALFLAGWMTLGMLETRADNVLSRVLGWPEWPFYLPGVVALLLWAAVAALQAFDAGDDGSA